MKIAVGADHRGHDKKEKIVAILREMNHEVLDMGTNSAKSCDYPDIAYPVAKSVSDGRAERAILICSNGIGMSISANKIKGVRAALCYDEVSSQVSRKYTDANILCLASDALGEEVTRRIVTSWMETEFESGGRHERRVKKICDIENGRDPACSE